MQQNRLIASHNCYDGDAPDRLSDHIPIPHSTSVASKYGGLNNEHEE